MSEIKSKKELSKMSSHEQVKLFTEKFGNDLTFTPYKARLLFSLLFEEVLELGMSLGVINIHDVISEVYSNNITKISDMVNKEIFSEKDNNVKSMKIKSHSLDALCDMRYYEEQILIMTETQDLFHKALTEVTYANLAKLGEDGKPIYSDGTDGFPKGKILKPTGWKAPDIFNLVSESIV